MVLSMQLHNSIGLTIMELLPLFIVLVCIFGICEGMGW